MSSALISDGSKEHHADFDLCVQRLVVASKELRLSEVTEIVALLEESKQKTLSVALLTTLIYILKSHHLETSLIIPILSCLRSFSFIDANQSKMTANEYGFLFILSRYLNHSPLSRQLASEILLNLSLQKANKILIVSSTSGIVENMVLSLKHKDEARSMSNIILAITNMAQVRDNITILCSRGVVTELISLFVETELAEHSKNERSDVILACLANIATWKEAHPFMMSSTKLVSVLQHLMQSNLDMVDSVGIFAALTLSFLMGCDHKKVWLGVYTVPGDSVGISSPDHSDDAKTTFHNYINSLTDILDTSFNGKVRNILRNSVEASRSSRKSHMSCSLQ